MRMEPDTVELNQEAGPDRLPDLIPARMVNEYTYCPRLAYLEWVSAEWESNAYTLEGSMQHRRVDTPTGAPGAPGDQDDTSDDVPKSATASTTTSLTLASPTLGVIAKMDRVEINGRCAVPVDHKHGNPPNTHMSVWETDRVQICVQALILRDNGYTCDRGVVYYTGTKERVDVAITEELVALTVAQIEGLRNLAARKVPPPPLVDSPKCPGCSLVGICLPDETTLLSSGSNRSLGEVRRLVPARDDRVPVYIQEQGASVSKRGDVLIIQSPANPTQEVRLMDISHLCLMGNVQISTQALRELCARSIPVCFHSYGGWFYGILQSMVHKNAGLRIDQHSCAADEARSLFLARAFVTGKIRNCRTLLRRGYSECPKEVLAEFGRLAAHASRARSVESLLGIEGAAAKLYFSQFSNLIKAGLGFDFRARNRRPPTDPINALLSFVYALLVKELTVTALAVGYDPYIGFYHRPRYGRPALALDLMEEFRPLICDSAVITAVNKGEIKASDFIERAGAVSLTPRGRRQAIAAYERRVDTLVTHPVFGYSISYRRVFTVQARMLARYLSGEVSAYGPFCTR